MQPHGALSVDPYHQLQIQPHAARDLIIEAYWIGIAQIQDATLDADDARDRIFDLNDAYAVLMNDAARAAFDEAHGYDAMEPTLVRLQPIDPKVPSVEMAVIADGSDYYRLLAIERRAAPGIVRAAYRSMLRMASGNSVRDFCLRELLAEVYETLSDPFRRAEYDATLPAERYRRDDGEREHDRLLDLAPTETPHVDGALIEEISAPTEEEYDDDEPDDAVPSDPLAALRHALKRADREERATRVAREAKKQRGLLGRRNGTQKRESTVRFETVGKPAPAPKVKEPLAEPPPPPPAREPKQRRVSEKDRTLAAEHDRLLALREPAEAPLIVDPLVKIAAPAPPPIARSAPRLAGPHIVVESDGGRAVPVGDDPLSVGAGAARDIILPGHDVRNNHAQVWLHRGALALRVAENAEALVNGEPMVMSLIFLDDGDVVQIADHRLRYHA